jgi:hypothetical protein
MQIQPISLNEENPHYFTFRGKPTVLITSAEHYGAVLNLDFDYKVYLDELQSNGLNNTRLFSGTYVEFPGWFSYSLDQPLSPAAGRFICPWARSSEPGYINGGNKFDLTKWDTEYFKRLKDFLTQASKRDIVVELALFCPYYSINGRGSGDSDLLWKYSPFYHENNINGIGKIQRVNALTLDNGNLLDIQEEFVRKVVSELKDYDNLIYEICNEPYVQKLVPDDWMAHISQVITDAESSFRFKHLQSHNVANGVAAINNPLPNASVFNFHYSNHTAITLNYWMDKVIGNNETAGESNIIERMHGWDFIIGGGGLFNNLDMSFTTTDPGGKNSKQGQEVLRSQLGILKKFIEGFDFVRMKPDSTVVEGVAAQGLSVDVLAETGVAYAIYLRKSDIKDLNPVLGELGFKLPSGNYKVEWLNPVSGNVDMEITFAHSGGEKKLNSPLFNTDVALAIRRIDGN